MSSITTTDMLPSINGLHHAELLALRGQIDARLEELRASYIAEAASLGLTFVDGTNGKNKRGRKPNTSRHQED